MRRRDLLIGSALAVLSSRSEQATADDPTPLVVPPEEAAHARTFMQWPVSRRVHPDPAFLDLLQDTIAAIANTIADFEPVVMLAAKQDHASAVRRLASDIALWDIPTEDLWCRDSGPLFARQADGSLAVSHIRFNGWGGRQVHRRDGKVAERLASRLGLPLIDSGLTGEAGGIEHDGNGLLIAHESSWVDRNRNPGLARDEIEKRLLAAYGARRMIWSPGVRNKDITDYHIDSLARFTGASRVLINLPDSPDLHDPFHLAGLQTRDRLLHAGLDIRIIPEPIERRIRRKDFVASYANYYVCNGAVIAAQFGDARTDEIAKRALQDAYPGRAIVALNVDALGEVGGGIHCATQQMPA